MNAVSGPQPPPPSVPERPITDSVWFWTCLFLTGALVSLAISSPKYAARQTQIERQYLARQHGGQARKGAAGETIEIPEADNLLITLGPLIAICGLLLIVAWSRLWWDRTGLRNAPRQDGADAPAQNDSTVR